MKYQWNIKTALVVLFGVTIILLSIFYPLNDLLATRVFEAPGKCIEERSSFVPGGMGTDKQIEYVIELDSGERAYLRKSTFAKPVKPGDKVIVFYRKGVVFGNQLYDRYEPSEGQP